MKWIGQHIYDFISRFRSDVYLESVDSGTIASGGNLGLDSNNKIVKATTVSSATLASTVTVTDSTANTDFPVVFHDESNGLLDDTGAFEYNPSTQTLTMISGVSNSPGIILENTNTDNKPPKIKFLKDAGEAGADGDYTGTINFFGDNSAQEETWFGVIRNRIVTALDTDEASKMEILVACSNGSDSGLENVITGTGHGTNNIIDVSLGYGATSTTTVAGNLTVTSDLTVSGTTTTINTTNLNVEDKNITLNYNASGDTSSTADGAGITIQDAVDGSNDASLTWTAATDMFAFSHGISVNAGDIHQHRAASGNNVHFDQQLTTDSGWTSGSNNSTGHRIVFNKDDNTATGNQNTFTGLYNDLNETSSNNVGTTALYGVQNYIDFSNANGYSLSYGLFNNITGGDMAIGVRNAFTGATTQYGVYNQITDGQKDLYFRSSDNTTVDYFSLTTKASAETDITTVDGGGAAAHLNFNVDGDIVFTPDTAGTNLTGYKFYLNDGYTQHDFDLFIKGESNPFARFFAESGNFSKLRIYEEGGGSIVDYLDINVSEHGATTITTEDSAAHAADLSLAIDGDIFLDNDGDGLTKITSDGVEIENGSSSGAAALLIDNDDVDQIALHIDAANTTASVISIEGNDITTGDTIKAVHSVDHARTGAFTNFDLTFATPGGVSANSLTGIFGDWDYVKTGNLGDSEYNRVTGLNLKIDDQATGNHANSYSVIKGQTIHVETAGTNGTILTGLDVSVLGGGGAEGSIGISTQVSTGYDFKAMSSADTGDYFAIATTTHGATTISTLDDDAHAADLTFSIDGFTKFDSLNNDGGGVEIETGTAAGVAALTIDNNDVDTNALLIEAANTTEHILDIEAGTLTTHDAIHVKADSLTTGAAINLDINDSLTTSATNSLLKIDYDKSGITGNGSGRTVYGLDLNMADAATNHTGGSVVFYGANIALDAASDQGGIVQRGINLLLTDGDPLSTVGVYSNVENGGVDFKSVDSVQTRNWFAIATGEHGETTLSTVDHDAAVAHLNFIVDGNMVLNPAGTISLDADTTITGGFSVAGGSNEIDLTTTGTLDVNANSLDMDLTDSSSITITSSEDSEDFLIRQVGAHDAGITLDAAGTGTDAIKLNASAGGITLDSNETRFTSSASGYPAITIINTTDDGTSPSLILKNDRASDGVDGDFAGKIEFQAKDDGTPSSQTYASIYSRVDDATSTEESGTLYLSVANHDGGIAPGLTLTGGSENDEVDVVIGNGANSVTTVAGNLNITTGLTGSKAGQIIHFQPTSYMFYLFYMNIQNFWYSPSAYSSTTGSNAAIGSHANMSYSNASYHAGYIAPRACKVKKIMLVGYFTSSYFGASDDVAVEWGLLKWTPQDDGNSTVAVTDMAMTDHDGNYREAKQYNKTFVVTDNADSTLAAGDAFNFVGRVTNTGTGGSTVRCLWRGDVTYEIELTE